MDMSVHINATGTLMLHVAVVLKGVCEVVLNCMLIRAITASVLSVASAVSVVK